MSMCSKTTPFILELFWQIQLAGLIEQHLDFGFTKDQHVLKSTYI